MSLIGLNSFHIAKVLTDTDSGTTYETPIKVPGIVSLSLSPQVETANQYADDRVYEIINNFTSVDGSVTLNELPTDIYQKLLGKTVGASGAVYDNGDDESAYYAIGFKAPKSRNRGDVYFWLYKGQFRQPDQEFNSKNEGAEGVTTTLAATFIKRNSDGNWRVFMDTEDEGTDATGFFTTVFEEPVTP